MVTPASRIVFTHIPPTSGLLFEIRFFANALSILQLLSLIKKNIISKISAKEQQKSAEGPKGHGHRRAKCA
jgi:hypothetical protein